MTPLYALALWLACIALASLYTLPGRKQRKQRNPATIVFRPRARGRSNGGKAWLKQFKNRRAA